MKSRMFNIAILGLIIALIGYVFLLVNSVKIEEDTDSRQVKSGMLPPKSSSPNTLPNTITMNNQPQITPDHNRIKTVATENRFDESHLIQVAYKEAVKHLEIPAESIPIVTLDGNLMVVTWPVVHDAKAGAQTPGPSFYAQVKINKESGQVVAVLGGS